MVKGRESISSHLKGAKLHSARQRKVKEAGVWKVTFRQNLGKLMESKAMITVRIGQAASSSSLGPREAVGHT